MLGELLPSIESCSSISLFWMLRMLTGLSFAHEAASSPLLPHIEFHAGAHTCR